MHYVVAIIVAVVTALVQILTRSVTVILEVMSRKILIIGMVLGALATFVTAFYLLISGVVSGISVLAPAGLSQAASLCVPDNFAALASIKITAQLARFAYEWNVKVLQWRLG